MAGAAMELLTLWYSPGGASNRLRALKQFFRWAVEEGEIAENPCAGVKNPLIPEEPPAVLTDDQVEALFKACTGKTFEDRRDPAIIRLLADTGMRRSELSELNIDDLDLDGQVAIVMGKGRRPGACPFGLQTAPLSTATCGCGGATPSPRWTRFGLACAAGSRAAASFRSCESAQG
jgi:site-specific recombinase XerD